MALQRIVPEAYLVPMGAANIVLLDGGDELALIDAGFPGKEQLVLAAIAELGRKPSDLKHLVFTHHHPDHIGSGAAIVRATGARTYMHPLDSPIAEAGGPFRPMKPGSGLLPRLLYLMISLQKTPPIEPVKIDQPIGEGETLPIAGGLRVIGTPGHGLLASATRKTDVARARELPAPPPPEPFAAAEPPDPPPPVHAAAAVCVSSTPSNARCGRAHRLAQLQHPERRREPARPDPALRPSHPAPAIDLTRVTRS